MVVMKKKMLGIPLDQLSNYLNIASVVAVPVMALVFGIMVYVVNERVSAEKDMQLEEYKASAAAEIAKAIAVAAEADKRTAELRQTNLQLSIQLEEERQQRIRLQQGVSSRSLTDVQRQKLEEAGDHDPIAIIRLGDHEAHQYATQIGTALQSSGIVVSYLDIGTIAGNPTGLRALGSQWDTPVITKLRDAGLILEIDETLPVHSAVRFGMRGAILLVGLKRPTL